MEKIKGFVFSESKLAKAIFGFLVVGVFALVFGPNIYAQFARQTGSTGWGYGYGYGYGYGSGFDGGTTAGYKTDFTTSATDVYGYGYGYGYVASGVTYDATNGWEVGPSEMAGLVTSGVMVPNGGSITSTTELEFTDHVTLTVASGVTVDIPSGTTFTAASAGDFSALTAANGVSTTALTGVTIVGDAMSFGVPSLDLTVSPAITISVTVGASYEGQTLRIYRMDAAGTWAYTGDGCVVTSGVCAITTTHLSSFATVTAASGGSSSGGGSGSGAAPACTSVTYGAYSDICFAGYQYRNIVSRTPANCALTAAQQEAARKICGASTPDPADNGTGEVSGADGFNRAFTALEKSLVKNISSALTKRLSGRILLQVEGHGESWYVNPVNGLKYYLGRPADAFALMRQLGLGVSEKDYNNFAKGTVPARLAGRILLRVQAHGEAYYVNPLDNKMYYMGRPADAFALMRKFGLGINNTNLRRIDVGELK